MLINSDFLEIKNFFKKFWRNNKFFIELYIHMVNQSNKYYEKLT